MRGSRDREAVEWQGETKVNIACDRPVRSFETNDDTIIRLPFHFPSYNTSWIGHRLGRRRGTSLHTSSHFFNTSDDEGNIADTGCSHLGDDFCRGPSSRGQRPLQVPRPSKVSLRGKVSEHLHAIARRPFDSDQSIPLRADGITFLRLAGVEAGEESALWMLGKVCDPFMKRSLTGG